MLTRLFASLLLFSAFHAGAQASIITVTLHGKITDEAIDKSAMFGPIGASLFGLDFTTTIRYTRPKRTDFSDPNQDFYNAQVHGAGLVNFEITINNRTLKREFVPIEMTHFVGDSRNGFADFSAMGVNSGNVPGGVVMAFYMYNYEDAFIPSRPSLETPISYQVVPADWAFGSVWLRPEGRSHGNLLFDAEYTHLEVSSDAVDMPEPASGVLLVVALAAAGLSTRRR
jgi:hypothetical protein